MGEIFQFPGQATTLGFRRVRQGRNVSADPKQLDLFVGSVAALDNPDSCLSLFERALRLDECEDERAGPLYFEAIASGECVADCFCNLGILESKKGNRSKAFDCFTTSLQHEPRHLAAHYNLGNLYFEVNNFRLAQFHYEMAVAIDRTFANVYFNLGLARSYNSDIAAAIEAFTQYKVLSADADSSPADDLLVMLKQSLSIKSQMGS